MSAVDKNKSVSMLMPLLSQLVNYGHEHGNADLRCRAHIRNSFFGKHNVHYSGAPKWQNDVITLSFSMQIK